MIKSLTITKGFEQETCGAPKGNWKECRTQGYPLPKLPIGTRLDFDSPLVIIIGPNGSGKSTIIEKLEAQTDYNRHYPLTYFKIKEDEKSKAIVITRAPNEDEQKRSALELKIQLGSKAVKIVQEEEKQAGILLPSYLVCELADNVKKTALEEESKKIEYYGQASTGQFQELHIYNQVEKINSKPELTVLCLDEPTLGLDMIKTKEMINFCKNYCFKQRKGQMIIATHETRFCEIPDTKIISLYEEKAKGYNSNEFDIENYLKTKLK